MNIYVGNLSYSITDDQLKGLFEGFGMVSSARVITDKFTGNSKGFGFVEMSSEEEGQKAIDEMNGSQYEGRTLVVNKARPREERPRQPRQQHRSRF